MGRKCSGGRKCRSSNLVSFSKHDMKFRGFISFTPKFHVLFAKGAAPLQWGKRGYPTVLFSHLVLFSGHLSMSSVTGTASSVPQAVGFVMVCEPCLSGGAEPAQGGRCLQLWNWCWYQGKKEKLSSSVVCCVFRDGNFREESVRKLKISLY